MTRVDDEGVPKIVQWLRRMGDGTVMVRYFNGRCSTLYSNRVPAVFVGSNEWWEDMEAIAERTWRHAA